MIHPSVARPDPLQRAVRGALLGLALSAAAAPPLRRCWALPHLRPPSRCNAGTFPQGPWTQHLSRWPARVG